MAAHQAPIHRISQARILEWVAIFFSRGSWTYLANKLTCRDYNRKIMKVKGESEVAQSCPALSNPMDCSLPGPSVHGILQARVLKWGAIAFSNQAPTRYLCLLISWLQSRSAVIMEPKKIKCHCFHYFPNYVYVYIYICGGGHGNPL